MGCRESAVQHVALQSARKKIRKNGTFNTAILIDTTSYRNGGHKRTDHAGTASDRCADISNENFRQVMHLALTVAEAIKKAGLCSGVVRMPHIEQLKQIVRVNRCIGSAGRFRRESAQGFDLICMFIKEIPHLMFVIQMTLRAIDPVALMSCTEKITQIMTDNTEAQRKHR